MWPDDAEGVSHSNYSEGEQLQRRQVHLEKYEMYKMK